MDFNFEYIIYIVLGLIFVLAQVAKKKKKAAQAQGAGSEGVESKPAVSFLEQLLGMPEQKPVDHSPVDNNQLPPEDLNPSSNQSGPRVSTTVPLSETADVNKAKPKPKSAGYQRVKRADSSGFDLRKAIIYQVVLERKNF